MSKEEEQRELLAENTFVYLGNGPGATGGGRCWAMSDELSAKCIQCGYMMRLGVTETEYCSCSMLHKDVDWGRFGSILGDDNIEIYRVVPLDPGD